MGGVEVWKWGRGGGGVRVYMGPLCIIIIMFIILLFLCMVFEERRILCLFYVYSDCYDLLKFHDQRKQCKKIKNNKSPFNLLVTHEVINQHIITVR